MDPGRFFLNRLNRKVSVEPIEKKPPLCLDEVNSEFSSSRHNGGFELIYEVWFVHRGVKQDYTRIVLR